MEYLILIVSLVGIVLGADWLVGGSVQIARRFKVSDFVIGAAIVGVGTSAPELMVSLMGAVQGNSDVALGNVVGSNIFNISLILGICSQVCPLSSSGITVFDYCVMIAAAVLTLFLGLDGKINRWEGLIMFSAFVGYCIYLLG